MFVAIVFDGFNAKLHSTMFRSWANLFKKQEHSVMFISVGSYEPAKLTQVQLFDDNLKATQFGCASIRYGLQKAVEFAASGSAGCVLFLGMNADAEAQQGVKGKFSYVPSGAIRLTPIDFRIELSGVDHGPSRPVHIDLFLPATMVGSKDGGTFNLGKFDGVCHRVDSKSLFGTVHKALMPLLNAVVIRLENPKADFICFDASSFAGKDLMLKFKVDSLLTDQQQLQQSVALSDTVLSLYAFNPDDDVIKKLIVQSTVFAIQRNQRKFYIVVQDGTFRLAFNARKDTQMTEQGDATIPKKRRLDDSNIQPTEISSRPVLQRTASAAQRSTAIETTRPGMYPSYLAVAPLQPARIDDSVGLTAGSFGEAWFGLYKEVYMKLQKTNAIQQEQAALLSKIDSLKK